MSETERRTHARPLRLCPQKYKCEMPMCDDQMGLIYSGFTGFTATGQKGLFDCFQSGMVTVSESGQDTRVFLIHLRTFDVTLLSLTTAV